MAAAAYELSAAAAAAEAAKWASVVRKAAAEAVNWSSVARKATAEAEKLAPVMAEAEELAPAARTEKWASIAAEAEKLASIAKEAAAETEKWTSVAAEGAVDAQKWAAIAISAAAAEQRSLSQDNVNIKNGLKEEEELVITNPKLARLIYHGFNIAFVLELIFCIAHAIIYLNASDVWWQALVALAVVSPLFVAPLYFMPVLRDVFLRAYATAPPDIPSSGLSSKLLTTEEV